jgi:hypothetical protein
MTSTDVVDQSPLHGLPFGLMAAKIVHAAAELRLADLLIEGPLTSADLAARAGAHEGSLRRLLRALAGLGIVQQVGADGFVLTAAGGPLRSDAPDSIHGLMTMLCGPENWSSWGELVGSVQSGETGWDRAHGASWIEFYATRPDRSENFNRAMAEHTRDAAPGIVEAADLSRYREVADVGGGDGTLVIEALRAHPELTAAIIDLPSGLAEAEAAVEKAGMSDRCRVAPGDFFDSVPAGSDAYLLKQVLHDWDDHRAADILKTLRRAMVPSSRLLIAERMLPGQVGPPDAPTLLVDVLMMVVTGGRERTRAEFEVLLARAGFDLVVVSPPLPPFDYRVIEAVPV